MKKGLILEGGAMRGMFTMGVVDYFMEKDLWFDGAIGVSAGAAFGCNYKSRQPERVIRYNKRFCRDWRYCSWRSFFRTGDLYGAKFCYDDIPHKLDLFDIETYKNSPMEFYVVCTDVETGKAVYKRLDKADFVDLEWMRASASMPLVSQIVNIDGHKLLDGGLADSIPLKYFENIGYEKNVVILTQPLGYKKSPNKIVPVAKVFMKKYPQAVEALANRHKIYNESIEYITQKEKNNEIFVIRPKHKLPVNHIEHDAKKLQEAYDIGRNTAIQQFEKLSEWLNSAS